MKLLWAPGLAPVRWPHYHHHPVSVVTQFLISAEICHKTLLTTTSEMVLGINMSRMLKKCNKFYFPSILLKTTWVAAGHGRQDLCLWLFYAAKLSFNTRQGGPVPGAHHPRHLFKIFTWRPGPAWPLKINSAALPSVQALRSLTPFSALNRTIIAQYHYWQTMTSYAKMMHMHIL